MSRPRNLIVVAGTGTEVGKTWAAQRVLERARNLDWRVAARKPAQSYSPGAGPTDADLLAAASGESPDDVCPRHRWYPLPMAPPMAADALGRPTIRLDELMTEIHWPPALDLALVETAGGLRSPLTHDADNVALIQGLIPNVVLLVADAGLGTINLVRLSVAALAGFNVVVLLNRFDAESDLHRRNRDWLAARNQVSVVTSVGQFCERLEQDQVSARRNG